MARMILVWMLMAMASCEKGHYDHPGDQPLFFEYHYRNHAWGFQEHGWLIDRQGHIRSFNLPEGYRTPDPEGYLSFEDLEHNLGLTDSVIGKVEADELERYVNDIPAAALGEIGAAKSIAADAGTSVLSCYMYDEEKDAYQYVFLAQSGDWEQFNLSDEAAKIVKWLLGFDLFWLSDPNRL